MTLYGTLAAGDIPELTSEELIGIVDGLNTTDARKKLIETALSLVGKVSYFWGGKSPAGWNNDWGKPKKVTGSGSVTSVRSALTALIAAGLRIGSTRPRLAGP